MTARKRRPGKEHVGAYGGVGGLHWAEACGRFESKPGNVCGSLVYGAVESEVKVVQCCSLQKPGFSDPKLAAYLTKQEKKLGLDVDKVYTPMIWGTNHWVGLQVSILDWSVLVYDPDRSLRQMEEVMKIMTPVAKMLPYLVRKVCPAEFIGVRGVEPFGVQLMADGYQNTRSGDCGPVAMKFMELAATGVNEPDVEDLSDSLVDIFRKQYAIDVYKDWVVPLYIGGDVGN